MSTITTTAPSFDTPRASGRRILVAGAVVVGLVAAGAVVIPRITSTTTTTSTTYPTITQHDAVEHRLDDSLASAARRQSAAVEQRLDLTGKQAAAVAASQYRVSTTPQGLARFGAAGRAQIGGAAPTFAWTPNHDSYLVKEQTGGGHQTYPFSSLHMTWADPWVPPTDNPEWVPYIKSHYFHPVTTTRPTHEYR